MAVAFKAVLQNSILFYGLWITGLLPCNTTLRPQLCTDWISSIQQLITPSLPPSHRHAVKYIKQEIHQSRPDQSAGKCASISDEYGMFSKFQSSFTQKQYLNWFVTSVDILIYYCVFSPNHKLKILMFYPHCAAKMSN